MNVVMVGPFGLRPKSTVSRRVLPLGKALAEQGHRVTVLIPSWDWPADGGREWTEGSAAVRSLPLGPALPGWPDLALVFRLAQATLARHPDVVHCFKPKGYAGLVALVLYVAQRTGLWTGTLIVDTDDWEGPGGWNHRAGYSRIQRWLFAWQERWGLTHSDGLTVASGALGELALRLGVPLQAVHRLPNGVPSWCGSGSWGESGWRRDRRHDSPTILCYTRFIGCGPARLAAIVSEVAARVPLARFLVVGEGLHGEEREFQARLAAPGRVLLMGWVAEEKLAEAFSRADLALFPLDDDPVNSARCPAKLVDLLAFGVPVLAEAVGEVPTYIRHDSSGMLLPPGSVPARWATEVTELLNNDSWRRRLGDKAREQVGRDFAWGPLAENLVSFYQRSIDVRRSAGRRGCTSGEGVTEGEFVRQG